MNGRRLDPRLFQVPLGLPPNPPAASTMEELADQFDQMLTCPKGRMGSNLVEQAVRQYSKEKRPYMESKDVLAILTANHIGSTPEKFLSDVLSKLKYRDTIKRVHMCPTSGSNHPFNFAKLSEQLAEHLPNVQWLNIEGMAAINFRIESTTIISLTLEAPYMQDGKWEIKCPNLLQLTMESHTPPVDNFQRGLINCPRIKYYYCHKYWNDDPLPTLYLPNCINFTHRRGDCNESLRLYLPRVKKLNLDANYDLERVQMLTEGHPDHAEWNLPPGAELSKFQLSLTAANMSARFKESLCATGRVINPSAFDHCQYHPCDHHQRMHR